MLRPSDAAFLLGVSRQSLWDRINRGTVETLSYEGGRWVCLECFGPPYEWNLRSIPAFDRTLDPVHFSVEVA
jgi:hypothetical protein